MQQAGVPGIMKIRLLAALVAIALLVTGCSPAPPAPLPPVVRDVGAHYYLWYGPPAHEWHDGKWSKESPSGPVLGDYNSADLHVIEQHIDWARTAGINWFNVSWWGPSSVEDYRLREVILNHSRAGELEWSILYETVGRLGDRIDMNNPANRSAFRSDLEYLAQTYFHQGLYKRMNDRPVLYIWAGQAFHGDVTGAYEEAVAAAGVRPYLIVDVPMDHPLDSWPITDIADAVTVYHPYAPLDDIEHVFLERMEECYRSLYLAQDHYQDLLFIPSATPGFDDTKITHVPRPDMPVLQPSPERYERTCELALKFARGPVFVSTFNEWYEDSQIEPGSEFGDAYLRITSDILARGEREPPQTRTGTLSLVFEELVLESELNPDVDNGRDLAMLAEHLTVRDPDGRAVIDIDVGGDEGNALFILGSYGQEGIEGGATWRWFGAGGKTVIWLPGIPEAGTIEIKGRAATRMSVQILIAGETRGQATIDQTFGMHVMQFFAKQG